MAEELRRIDEPDDVALAFSCCLDELHDAGDDRSERDGLVAVSENMMIGRHYAPARDGTQPLELFLRQGSANSAMPDKAGLAPPGIEVGAFSGVARHVLQAGPQSIL